MRNVLLVDTSLPEYEVVLQSVNETTQAIPYSMDTTYHGIIKAISINGARTTVDQLGIFCHKDALFLGRPLLEQYVFFSELVQNLELKHLDFLACDTLNDTLYKAFYEKFTNVIIGASNNRTGNLQYGGDWTMESTMEDVESIYFTRSIEYYKYLLEPDIQSHFFTKNTGELYGLGRNEHYNLGKNYGLLVTEPTEVFMKDASNNLTSIGGIQKLKFANRTTIFVKNDKLYGMGNNDNNVISSTISHACGFFSGLV